MLNSSLIEKFNSIKTPFYYYDLNLLEENLKFLRQISSSYDYQIHYALKANANGPIIKKISGYGFGADCVSGNEMKRALDFKFPKQKIVLAGVGKTDKEIKLALRTDIQCINCESLQELEVINHLARKFPRKARIALRIKPDVEANTHRYITTGRKDNKLGISMEELEK